jgi:PEP-CTERM motif
MRNILLGATLLSGLAFLAPPAMAANTALILWNAADPGDAEAATGTGSAVLSSSDLDGITITVSNVNRETSPNGMTENNVNITNTTGTTQVLRIIAGSNGFAGPTNEIGLSATILTALGTSDLAGSFFSNEGTFLNGTTLSVTGTDIENFDSGPLTGPRSFSFNGEVADLLTGQYGLAESLTLTLQAGATIGVQSISMDATNAVPEPSTWAMGIAGFAMLAGFGWKRSRKNRIESALA